MVCWMFPTPISSSPLGVTIHLEDEGGMLEKLQRLAQGLPISEPQSQATPVPRVLQATKSSRHLVSTFILIPLTVTT